MGSSRRQPKIRQNYSVRRLESIIERVHNEAIAESGIGSGDITAVNAGNGLSGGGTSGDVTLNLDIANATDGTGISVASSDLLLVADADDSNNVKRINISQLPAASVAGSNTQIQFNNSGVFGASANLTFDGTNMEITGAISVNGNIGVGIPAGAITHAITLPDNADATGKIKANAYLTYSSARFKEDVEVIENPIEIIKNLRGVSFTWKKNSQKDYGFIAEEVGKQLPIIVEWDTKANQNQPQALSMDYTRIIPFLLEGIKSQQKQIDSLKDEIKYLKRWTEAE